MGLDRYLNTMLSNKQCLQLAKFMVSVIFTAIGSMVTYLNTMI